MNLSIVELALKISVVMVLAAVAAGLMRRRASAASRHLVWTLAVLGVLMLPIASRAMPSWTMLHIPAVAGGDRPAMITGGIASSREGSAEEVVPHSPSATSMPWQAVFPAAYATGVLLLLVRLGVEQWRIRRLVSRAAEVSSPEWTSLLRECSARIGVRRPVKLVQSHEHAMPMACGLLRSVVLIPSVAEMWDDDRRRAVLLHELAHVARFDCVTQMLAELAVSLYWPHPGAWWVARRLQLERELACDDCVLSAGTEPREYAGHLLELAYSLGGGRAPALAVTMARPRQLEGRMLAMLDPTRSRATVAAKRRLLAVAVAAVVVAPLAAATTGPVPVAVQGPGTSTSVPAREGVAALPMPVGTWEIRSSGAAGRLELTLNGEHHSFQGTTVAVERLEGISPALLSGAAGPAMFSLRRDAGTLTFEGVFRSGVGAGTYTFNASTAFPQELARRGFARPTPVEQWALALADVGFAFLDELTAQKYARPDLVQLVSAAQHGASADYVRQMGQLGYRLGTVEALIRQRDHGVSPSFIRELRAQGLDGLTADDLVRARDHGVSPEYVSQLRALGYTGLTMDGWVGARDHGISPEYVRDLRPFGYQLSLAELTRARDHGVSVEYIKALAGLGYEHVSLDDLVRLRDHGVSPDWLGKVKTRSSARLSIDDLVRMRDHGLDSPARGPQLHGWNLRATLKAWCDRWLN